MYFVFYVVTVVEKKWRCAFQMAKEVPVCHADQYHSTSGSGYEIFLSHLHCTVNNIPFTALLLHTYLVRLAALANLHGTNVANCNRNNNAAVK